MAKVDLSLLVPGAVSAELDIASGAEVAAVAEAMRSGSGGRSHPVPKVATLNGTVTATQATAQLAYFAADIRPQVGRLWSCRKLVIMVGQPVGSPVVPSEMAATLANVTAAVYVSGQPRQPGPADVEVTQLTIPTTQFFSGHQLTVRGSNAWLVVGVAGSGVTQGLQISAYMRGIEIDDDPAWLLDL